MSEPLPSWVGWILPSLGVGGVVWAFGKRFFATVTRAELQETIKAQELAAEARSTLRHEENLRNFQEMFKRMRFVEDAQNTMNGRMDGRWGRPSPYDSRGT